VLVNPYRVHKFRIRVTQGAALGWNWLTPLALGTSYTGGNIEARPFGMIQEVILTRQSTTSSVASPPGR
jgi:hypothetical protein